MSQIEIINSMLLFLVVVGIIMLIIGIFFIKEKQNINAYLIDDKQEEIDKQLNDKIEEADKMLQELNEFSSYLKSDVEKKYKELLFLYQLIDEKEKNISNLYYLENQKVVSDVDKIEENIQEDIEEDIKKNKDNIETNLEKNNKENMGENTQESMILNNKNYDNIIKLYKRGVNPTDIAKELDIGKGEVELVLSLTKMR
ncbi:DUF6115 domain-containing protein [Defluviitalea phaphyphila]|uniref:DUF6115 domain-containing protein n=1 Tax=Defluviitalea phaphyphila TaxID=1473580 RepID=UPI00072FB850|nr:hypothetical protein [Defluviitalea phaphyphila]